MVCECQVLTKNVSMRRAATPMHFECQKILKKYIASLNNELRF